MFNNNKTIRKYIGLYGKVKGVGFRSRTEEASKKFSVTGWMRNEGDDFIGMEIQGTKREINRFIRYLKRGKGIRIENVKAREITVVPDESGFSILY